MRNFSAAFAVACCMLICPNVDTYSQSWVLKMEDPSENFFDIQNDFNTFWEGKAIEKGKGWKPFKRWEWFVEQRVYPDGNRAVMHEELHKFYIGKNSATQKRQGSNYGSWNIIGPSVVPDGSGGAGRLNFISFHPSDTNILYVGAPAGGLWVSKDGGSSWTTSTDSLEVIGASDLAINPLNPNTMYLATGDGDGGDTYSVGVLKSVDGGQTWNTTNLNWPVSYTYKINKLIIHPTDTNKLFAATNGGIYGTDDGGQNWTQIESGNFKDIIFRPGDPSYIYACGNEFYVSDDTGGRFTQTTSGLPSSSSVYRMAIAVSEANSDYVYVVAAASSDYGFYGLYRSTDKGNTFSAMSTTPNLLGWESDGSDAGGQGWYDLAVTCSNSDPEEVYIGGVNIWKSSDGGRNWSISSHWYGQGGTPYVHADVHKLFFTSHNEKIVFACTDGGLFKSTNNGTSWSDLSDGLAISQMYRLGGSATDQDLIMTGLQDNGTNLYDNGAWDRIIGGDGMECIIDYNDPDYMYGEYYYGNIKRSSNGGLSFVGITSGISETGAWVTPFVMDPVDPATLYAGFVNVWKTDDRGSTWSQLSNFMGSSTLRSLAVAPSNPNYIYAATLSSMNVTTDGGSNWADISSGLPTSSASITYIVVNPSNPDQLWVTFSGYSSGNKIYKSDDAGSSWTNVSGTLPNLPVNCVVYEKGSNNGIYVGTDVGVYYMDDTLGDWVQYMSGLPNVVVSELEIQYDAKKVRAATFGRGIWESDLYSTYSLAPNADFEANGTVSCPNTDIQFEDKSSFLPTSWKWSFPGGTPASSTDENPVVQYASQGTYQVRLIVTNANGSDTLDRSSYISVVSDSVPYLEVLEADFPPDGWEIVNEDNDVTWDSITVVSSDGSNSVSAYLNNFNYTGGSDEIDELLSIPIDITNSSSATLIFDVSYTPYDASYYDELNIYISSNCGFSYEVSPIYTKSGDELQTIGSSQTSEYFPSSSNDWRSDSVDLTPYVGNNIVLKFEAVSGWGNNLFIDNIQIEHVETLVSVEPQFIEGNINLYPNPFSEELNIILSDNLRDGKVKTEITDINGSIVYSTSNHVGESITLNLSQLSNGIYFLKVNHNNQREYFKVTKQ